MYQTEYLPSFQNLDLSVFLLCNYSIQLIRMWQVRKHSEFQDSRCFYAVSVDGVEADFSYRKCLDNFLKEKYPEKAESFIPKYFKKPQPRVGWNRDQRSPLPPRGEAGTPRGWNSEEPGTPWGSQTPGPQSEAGTGGWGNVSTPAAEEVGTGGWGGTSTPAAEEGGTPWGSQAPTPGPGPDDSAGA